MQITILISNRLDSSLPLVQGLNELQSVTLLTMSSAVRHESGRSL